MKRHLRNTVTAAFVGIVLGQLLVIEFVRTNAGHYALELSVLAGLIGAGIAASVWIVWIFLRWLYTSD